MTDESKSWINKNVIALCLIIVAVVASAYIYLNTMPEREYETYSRFGFSFEYPEGMELREQGIAFLLVSEDLDEIMALSDRIVIMSGGSIVQIFEGAGARREEIGLLIATGSSRE